MYNDIVLDYFTNPRNVGVLSEADGIGRSGNPVDGDSITIYIKVQNGILQDVRFKTFGCGAAIAASSMLTVLAAGKSLEYAMNITNDDVAEALGGLPPQKLLCSNFAADALYAAIDDYEKNKQHHTECRNSIDNISEESSSINEGITDKNQIQRYLRHIIIPKISGAGQKKLLETSVLVCGESIDSCDVLLSYTAASGIGQIYLFLESYDKYESVLAHVHDLNPEVNIELIKSMDQLKNQIQVDFNILVGDFHFISRMSGLLKKSSSDEFSPTLISAAYGWQGRLGLCGNVESMQDFLAKLSKEEACPEEISPEKYFHQLGMSMSYGFMGTLAVIELIKTRLNIGNIINDIVYFNLLEMVFCNNMSQLDCKIEFNNQIKRQIIRS